MSNALQQVREELVKWANLSGQDKCWHHEDVLTKLCEIFEIHILEKPELPARHEFEKGCKDYQDRIYSHCPRCQINLQLGVAMNPDVLQGCFNTRINSDGSLIKVLKCSQCGYSEIIK